MDARSDDAVPEKRDSSGRWEVGPGEQRRARAIPGARRVVATFGEDRGSDKVNGKRGKSVHNT